MVQINNCNNIDTGEISIVPDCLNIKHAINGTGKTTIAKAIEYHFTDLNPSGNSIVALKPFKAEKDNTITPSISGLDGYNSVAIFNEDYINQFTFEQSGELMKGSFEVFVKDEEYIARMEEIDKLLKDLVKSFQEDENLNVLIDDLC